MSDAAPSALAGEGPGAMTEAQVMEGIEGLLSDERPKKRQPPRQLETRPLPGAEAPAVEEQGSQDPMPGPEDPATGEEEEDYTPEPDDALEGDDVAGHQGIEPPDSWIKAEDKDVFRALPPEAQAVIARRESEQNVAFTRKTQEIAETRKALQSTIETVQQRTDAYDQNLRQLLAVAMPEVEKFNQIDWTRLAQEQPADYVRMTAERDALRGRLGTIQQELQQVEAQRQQAHAYQFAQIRQVEQQRLVDAIPEYGDPEKGPAKIAGVRNWLSKKGFSDQEIGAVLDHRVLLVVEEAMQADRMKQVRQQAQQKRSNGGVVQPPGASRAGPDNRAAQRRQQKMTALRQSGSEKDAIGYLMEIL